MSNTITAFFKGRVGVCESLYQYDYGMVMVLDDIDFGSVFDGYFETTGEEDAIPVIGMNNRIAIPDSCMHKPGIVTLHIPVHTGLNDSEVEYTVTFKVINRARPIYDGTPEESTAIAKAIAALQNIQGDVNAWLDAHPEATTSVEDGSLTAVKFTDDLQLKTIKDYLTPQMFGAKGDGTTDDYEAFVQALTACANSGKMLLVPAGEYYLTQTIHLEDLPYTLIGQDYRYRIVIKGIDPRKCRLIFAEDCTHGLYFKKGSNDYRGFTIDGLGIYTKAYSEEAPSERPDFTGIYLEYAPDTIIKNIWMTGCSYGIYIKGGWNTELEHVHVQRSVGAITFDGYNESLDAVGYCDNIRCKYIFVGTYPHEYGLKLKGVVSAHISNLDAENASGAAAVIIESSNNITIENFYVEWFLSESVFKISEINTNSYQFIPKNIRITNGKIYRCDAYSFYLVNCVDSEISYVSQATNYHEDSPYGIGQFIGVASKSSDRYYSRDVNNINLFGNTLLSQIVTAFTSHYRLSFNFNGQKLYHNPYYSDNYYIGTPVWNVYTNGEPDMIWGVVTESGSFGEDPNTTASGTAGEKKIVVGDSSKLYVGTFIDVGTDKQLQVLRIDDTNVFVHKALASNHTNTSVTIHNPVITKYNHQSNE